MLHDNINDFELMVSNFPNCNWLEKTFKFYFVQLFNSKSVSQTARGLGKKHDKLR